MKKAPLVLMFYDGFERKAREKALPRLFHRGRCLVRAIVRRARGKQVNTGFYEAFLALVEGLRRLGCDVRINDFAEARRRPSYPIGIAGYPEVIDQVDLPNPTIFGPGDPGYPDMAAEFARRPNAKHIIQPSDWFVKYYEPFCGDKMIRCPVGIDLDSIPDAQGEAKSVDMLIYDKIRWYRDRVVPAVLDRLIAALEERGMSYTVLRYGAHTRENYFASLKRSRSMAFICEHETQGLACEEALAMNVPVFAWDEGKLVDPLQLRFAQDDLEVSSVPYFDGRCGLQFKVDAMEEQLDRFRELLPTYRPREYIAETLQPSATARVFLDAYCGMMEDDPR
ncbi:hypothetical protein FHS61_000566 [Altererythrobacter atlanticus]|uniref:Uncharacterized protein n=1 Tax=Croceibacterium atlanticum TaxID=1267766 RepID=A0A0F7KQI6_9SPHN|nr:glycosyltransferase [Croceibacterium atlanticum]AKH42793.1 hypothetical protein WYH_01757 [Croceibacterium atlanticum]MBB5731573.1 hypothetical protein [Croceibacterium atlanticum]